jgi:hypothetical protein
MQNLGFRHIKPGSSLCVLCGSVVWIKKRTAEALRSQRKNASNTIISFCVLGDSAADFLLHGLTCGWIYGENS